MLVIFSSKLFKRTRECFQVDRATFPLQPTMNSIHGGPQNLPFAQTPGYHPRTHSRSASWSHTSGANTSIPLLSPIRVIQEFVPSFTNASRQGDSENGLTSRNCPRHGHISRQSSVIDMEPGDNNIPSSQGRSPTSNGRQSGDRVEFYSLIAWAENIMPFVLLLLSRIMWDHRLG